MADAFSAAVNVKCREIMGSCKLQINSHSTDWQAMINISSNFGNLGKDLERQLRDAAEENLANELVATVRSKGLKSADQIDLKIDADGRSMGIDAGRVIRIANRKLGV